MVISGYRHEMNNAIPPEQGEDGENDGPYGRPVGDDLPGPQLTPLFFTVDGEGAENQNLCQNLCSSSARDTKVCFAICMFLVLVGIVLCTSGLFLENQSFDALGSASFLGALFLWGWQSLYSYWQALASLPEEGSERGRLQEVLMSTEL